MTDPTQTTNPPQQGLSAGQAGQQGGGQPQVQQQVVQQPQAPVQNIQSQTDDILWWEDIFAPIPEVTMDDDLPYGDMLEKKYQFEPIPEDVVENTASEVVQPEAVQPPQQTPVAPSVIEKVAEQEVQDIWQQAGVEQETVDSLLDTKLQTDVQKKFGELFFTTTRIYTLKEKLGNQEEVFDILWADNDKVFIVYRCFLDTEQHTVVITKIEQDKTNDTETTNELRFMFNQETLSLEVMVNDIMLFDEIQDFTEDQKKKMQVSEKLNKFIFLVSEEQKKLEKEIQNKEEEEREKRKLQDIFRNF